MTAPERIQQKRILGVSKSAGRRDNYRWVQLVARRPNGEIVYGDFVQLSDERAFVEWSREFNGADVFHPICVYAEPDYRARYVVPLYAHVHSKRGADAARKATLAVHEQVLYMLDCRLDSLQLYFDGEDGFDLLVPFDTFDAFYSPWIFPLYAQWAAQMDSPEEHVVDRDIYHQDHLWRLPSSRCGERGLYKVHLTLEEMQGLSPHEILAIAASPRDDCSRREFGPDKYAPWWYKRAIRRVAKTHPSCLQCSTGIHNHNHYHHHHRRPPCVRILESTTLPDGTRHRAYCELASCFAYLNVHYPEIVAWLEAIDRHNPIRDPQDIKRAAQFGCFHPACPPCGSELKRHCPEGGCEQAERK